MPWSEKVPAVTVKQGTVGGTFSVFKNYKDALDGGSELKSWIWLTQIEYKNEERPVLELIVTGNGLWKNDYDPKEELPSLDNGLSMGDYLTVSSNYNGVYSESDGAGYIENLNTFGKTDKWTSSSLIEFNDSVEYTPSGLESATKGADLVINLTQVETPEAPTQFFARIYAGRNDTFSYDGDPTQDFDWDKLDKESGASKNNRVFVNLGANSQAYLYQVIGGKSSEVGKRLWNLNHANGTPDGRLIGFEASNNQVIIRNNATKFELPTSSTDFSSFDPSSINLFLYAGLYGAEGLYANNNFVSIENVIESCTLTGSADTPSRGRKIGIVGGKAWDVYIMPEDPADASAAGQATGNIVYVKNSNIDYGFDGDTKGEYGFFWSDAGDGQSIYGGYSYGTAVGNYVIVEDSVIDGNIYGGFEFDSRYQMTYGEFLSSPRTENFVSLHNVATTGNSAVYGSAKAWTASATSNVESEKQARVINGRRGTVYAAGANYTGSVYAQRVIFGAYLTPGTDSIPLGVEPAKFLVEKYEPNSLGNLLGESYVITASGFHSDLKVQATYEGEKPDYLGSNNEMWGNGSQVYFTYEEDGKTPNDDHNFWESVQVYVSSVVDGSGYNNNKNVVSGIDTETGRFTLQFRNPYDVLNRGLTPTSIEQIKDGKPVEEEPVPNYDAPLSLLVHDDGLTLVLGLSPSGGTSNTAVSLDWAKVAGRRQAVNEKSPGAYTGLALQGYTTIELSVIDEKGNIKNLNAASEDTVGSFYTTDDGTKDGRPFMPITQDGKTVVAYATYEFSNVLWSFYAAEGEETPQGQSPYQTDENGHAVPSTNESTNGEIGGVGLRYRLVALNLVGDLTLYGRNQLDPNESEENNSYVSGSVTWQPPTNRKGYIKTENSEDTIQQGWFTMTAQLTGTGGVTVPENNVVIIGGTEYLGSEEVGLNTYTGPTTVRAYAILYANEDRALGYTSMLYLSDADPDNQPLYDDLKPKDTTILGGQYFLNGHDCQTVGSLYVGKGASVTFDNLSGLDNPDSQFNPGKEVSPKLTVASTVEDDQGNVMIGALPLADGFVGARIRGHLRGTIKGEKGESVPNLLLKGADLEILSSNLNTPEANNADQEAGVGDTPKPVVPGENAGYYYSGEVTLTSFSNAKLYNTTALAGPDTTIIVSPSNAAARSGTTNSLTFMSGRVVDGASGVTNYIGNIQNGGNVYVSPQGITNFDQMNNVVVQKDFEGLDGGTLWFNTELAGDNANTDLVTVQGTATGSNFVAVQNVNGAGASTDYGILIMKVMGPESDNSLDLTMDPKYPAAAGAWFYSLEKKPLIQTAADGTPILDENGQFQILTGDEAGTGFYLVNNHNVRSEAGAYVDNSMAWSKMHMRLHDRMGQAYYKDPFTGEIKEYAGWVREVGEHTHFRMHGGDIKTHFSTTVTQFGFDVLRKKFDEDKPDSWKYTLGVMAGGLYAKGKSRTIYTTRSKVRGAAVGIYGTLYEHNTPDDPKGLYVDSWVMWNYFKNDIYDPFPQFDYRAKGFTASLEAGYTFKLGESDVTEVDGTPSDDRATWLLQPQAQVIWDGVHAKHARDAQGTAYKQLGKNNVVTRVGARLMVDRAKKGIGFLEGNWIHNTRKRGVAMDGYNIYQDGAKDSGEVRIGVEGHLSENLLGWFNAGLRVGTKGYHDEMVAVGVKYMF